MRSLRYTTLDFQSQKSLLLKKKKNKTTFYVRSTLEFTDANTLVNTIARMEALRTDLNKIDGKFSLKKTLETYSKNLGYLLIKIIFLIPKNNIFLGSYTFLLI